MLTTDELLNRVNAQHEEIADGLLALNKNFRVTCEDLGKSLSGVAARLQDVEQRVATRGAGGGINGGPGKSWGTQVTASDEYRTFKEGGFLGTRRIRIENALTSASGSGGALIAPDRQREVVTLPHRRLTVRDLLAPGTTTSNLVQFTRMLTYSNSAAVVSEGMEKPESSMTFELADAKVVTLAHWIAAARQTLDDASQLQSLIDGEMRYGLGVAEEDELLFGDGSGEHLLGLVPQAVSYSALWQPETPTRFDQLLIAIAQVEQSKIPATGIVLNSLDYRKLASIKDGENRYISQGPLGAQLNVAWNVPIVSTPAMTEGQFLVGGFDVAAQIFDRMLPEVQISSEDRDNFIRNMLTIRAEERLALAVRRPNALVAGTFQIGT